MLTKVDKFLQKRRLNPSVRPEQPFKTSLPSNYSHPRWLWPFGPDNRTICRQLNILIENFPDRYNPSSVLQIDMFNTSEEKLQDQLTKTMSVVFEGVLELGGQSAENRRLTYAWRLRHMLSYNASRQSIISHVLTIMIILFTTASTTVACLYQYYTSQSCSSGEDDSELTGVDVLLKLNLLLPLAVTIFRGLYASLNPWAKYLVLKSAALRVESEIYM